MRSKLVLFIILIILAAGTAYFWYRQGFEEPVKEKLTAEKRLALEIAQNHLQALEKYRYWTKQGFEYALFDIYPSFPPDSPNYRPELWTVYFVLHDVTDQGIRITVDINKKIIITVDEDAA